MPPHPFLIALQFLTRLPLRLSQSPTPEQHGRALLWYPLVGLLLGLALWVLAVLLAGQPAILVAALLLAFWVLATGALHLDGLADCADAWIGGHGDRERTLAILRDPAAGPVAVVLLLLVLLLKFAALAALLEGDGFHFVILAPLLARCALLPLFLLTPYVRANGLGSALASHLPRRGAITLSIMIPAAVVACFGYIGLLACIAAALTFALLRALSLRRIAGFTGDVAGALVELVEVAVLVVLVIA